MEVDDDGCGKVFEDCAYDGDGTHPVWPSIFVLHLPTTNPKIKDIMIRPIRITTVITTIVLSRLHVSAISLNTAVGVVVLSLIHI